MHGNLPTNSWCHCLGDPGPCDLAAIPTKSSSLKELPGQTLIRALRPPGPPWMHVMRWSRSDSSPVVLLGSIRAASLLRPDEPRRRQRLPEVNETGWR
jgi:hypothetical protein